MAHVLISDGDVGAGNLPGGYKNAVAYDIRLRRYKNKITRELAEHGIFIRNYIKLYALCDSKV
jgi:hypothetical protein